MQYKGEIFKNESILGDMSTHFTPCHPQDVRKGFIKGAARRLRRNNSSKVTFKENITQFNRTLRDRGYPDNLLETEYSLRS